MRYGRSTELLPGITDQIDIFLHDSDHSHDNEMAELMQIETRLHPRSIVLSDNSYTGSALYDFAASTGRRYLHFQEISKDHFYTGAGFGAAWR